MDPSKLPPGIDLSKIPSGIPPDGVKPNFIDPENIGYIPRIGIYVLLPIMLVAVTGRIATRLKMTRTLGLDDVICLIGVAFTIAFFGLVLKYLGDPMGKHQWDIPVSELNDDFIRTTFEGVVIQYLAVMFIKLSILVFYLKIFKPIKWARIAIWTGLAAVLAFYIIIVIVQLVLCVPRAGQTWLGVAITRKWTSAAIDSALAASWFGTVADFYILAIPISLLSTLQLSRKHKFGVIAIFMTGLIACGCSAANLAQRYKLAHHDMTYNDTLAYIYSIIEINVAIICSCMPAFTTPIKVMTSRMMSSWSNIKKRSQRSETTLPPKESGDGLQSLPQIPAAKISGLRTFIRRFDRSTSEKTTVMVDVSNFSKLGSVDEDYHHQLRVLHGAETPYASTRPSPHSTRVGGYI